MPSLAPHSLKALHCGGGSLGMARSAPSSAWASVPEEGTNARNKLGAGYMAGPIPTI